MEPYYYGQLRQEPLGKEKQQVYYAMLDGLTKLSPSFAVPRLSGEDLTEVFSLVRLDHPEIFYAPTFTYRFYSQADSVEMVPEYMFPKKQIQEHQKALASRIRKLTLPAEKLGEWDREQYVHDFICRNVRYDKLKKSYSHEIIGPLTQGVGVCEGIAKTVKILCDALQIPCIVAFCHNNPEKGIRYRHAWNLVRVGGKWVHLDATFDNSLSAGKELIRYDYFNIGDKALFRDHEPLVWEIPACTDNSAGFYQVKKLAFTKMEQVRSRAAQSAKKGKPLLFQWRGGYLTKEVLKEICLILEEEASGKQKTALVSLNWPQAVVYATFAEANAEAPESRDEKEDSSLHLQMEEANEGEKYEGE